MSDDGLPKIGELLAGRYRILQELGRGGYGVVYRARQDVMGRDVALKVLNPDAAKKEVEVERFRREVFHASGLRHPNTIQLFDFGEANGLFFIVMEYLEGVNLRDYSIKHGAMDHDTTVEVALQVLKSLREAHEHGIVHRDLKPENIYLLDTGESEEIFVKVLDFGLSKYVEGSPSKEPTLTKEGIIFGTPQYMSPEQAYGKKVRPETDIYALGLLLYEMVTARSAFTGRSSMEILIKQVSQPLPKMPEKLQGTLLSDFVEVCTQKEISERFPNAGAAYSWLVRKRSESSMVAMVKTIPAPPPTIPNVPTVEPEEELEFVDVHELHAEGDFDIEMRLAQLPLVGREQELDDFILWSRQSLFTGGVAWVTGGIGIGKTRFVDEWIRHLELEGVQVLRGGYHEDGGTLEGLRDALRPVTDKNTSREISPVPLQSGTVRNLKAALQSEEEQTPGLGQDWAFASIENALFKMARERPTVLVLEDLQWADSFTVRLLDHWQEELASRSVPLVLVLTSRTDEQGASQKLNQLSDLSGRLVGMSFSHALQLSRLSDDDSRRLLNYLMPLRDDVRDHVEGLAKGNPLFLTQVCRYLAEESVLEFNPDQGYWAVREGVDLRTRVVPPTLSDLLLRRVKRLIATHSLGAVLKALLCRAMLLGNRFEPKLLKTLLREESRQDLESYMDDAIEQLIRSGILTAAVIQGQPALEFSYNIMRTSLIDSEITVGESLQDLHRAVAKTKESFYENASLERKGELAASIADHYQRVQESRLALEWLNLAADHAEESQDFRGALHCHNDATGLLTPALDPHGERLLRIRLAQGRLHSFLGEFGPAEFALKEATEEAQRVGDTVGEALAGESLAGVLKLLARYEEATHYYEHTKQLFMGFPDEPGILRCRVGLGEIERFKGKYINAQKVFEACRDAAVAGSLPEIELRSIYGLGQCAYAAGDLLKAKELFQNTRKRAEFAKQWRLVSQADIELAMIAFLTDSVTVAEQKARIALDSKRNLGDSLGQAHAHLVLGMCLRRSTRIAEADFHATRARAISERLSHKYTTAKATLLQGEIAWMKANLGDALRHAEEARKLHHELADNHGLALSLIYSGLFELERGEIEAARRFLSRALELGGSTGLGLYQANCLLFLGMCLEAEDNLEDAVAYYGESLQLSEGCGNREVASLAAISLAKIHLVLADMEAVKEEIPIARNQAERIGNNIALMFAFAGEAWLARLTNNPRVLQSCLQKLRLLGDARTGINLRVPERIYDLAQRSLRKLPPAKARPNALAAAEVIESLGADKLASRLRSDAASR